MSTSRPPRPGRPPDPEARAERRRQILAGARRCFIEKGFHAASVADISRSAGVSVANLYQYFPSKQNLVLAVAEEDLESDLAIGLDPTGTFFERIERFLTLFAREARQNDVASLRVEIVAESMRNPDLGAAMARIDAELQRHLEAKITAAQEEGEIAPELDPTIVATMLLRVIEGFYIAVGAGMIDPDALVPHFVRLLRRGLEPANQPTRRRPSGT